MQLIGRGRELEELGSCLDSVLFSSRGELVLISGEPGVGKTALADAIAAVAKSRGIDVRWGHCFENVGGPAFWPWTQVLRSLIDESDNSDRHVSSEIITIRRLMHDLNTGSVEAQAIDSGGTKPVHSDPERSRFQLFDSILSYLMHTSESTPRLLIFDDVHAADESSLRLLAFLAKQIRQMRIVLVIIYRGAEIKQRSFAYRIVTDIARESHKYSLEGFQEEDVRAFVEAKAPGIRDSRFVNRLYRATEGNPYFLNEIIGLLTARHSFEKPSAWNTDRFEIPEQIGAAVRLRCELLSEATRLTLDVAATIGLEFDALMIARVMETDLETVLTNLSEAQSQDLVRATLGHSNKYRFVHTLFAETLYNDLALSRRQHFHQQIATILKAEHGDFSALANQMLRALPRGDAAEAMEYAKQAAHRATQALAYEDAANLLQLALKALDDSGAACSANYCELTIELAESNYRAGDFRGAIENFEKAALMAPELGDARFLARAVLGCGSLPETPGVVNSKLIKQLELAIGLLGDCDNAWRARLLGRLAEALQWSAPDNRRGQLAKEAVDLARRVGDPTTLVEVLYRMYVANLGPDTASERLATSTEILELTRGCQNPRLGLRAGYLRIRDLLELGHIDDLDREIQLYAQMSDELRQRHFGYTEAALAMRASLDGRFDEAEELALEALNLGQSRNDGMAAQVYATQISLIRREQNRLSEMEPTIKTFVVQFPDLVFARCALAFCYSEMARRDDAAFHFEELAQDDFSRVRRDVSWLACMALLSETCAFLADTPRAEILYRNLLPFSSSQASLDIYVSYGPVALYLGMLAIVMSKFEAAEKHLRDAMRVTAQCGERPWHAHAKCLYAEMLANRGSEEDRETALDLVDSALASTKSMAMAALEKRLIVLDSQLGPDKRSRAITHLLGQHGRTLATIMFLDIVDSTVHASRVGDVAWTKTLDSYYELIRRELKQFNGIEINTFGDDFFALFKSSAEAVRCASSIRTLVKEIGINVRAGLHAGECELNEGKVSGIAVHIGARVVRFAGSGEIVVSSTVKDVMSGTGFDFDDRGTHELKGVPGAWRLFALRAGSF